MHQHEKETGRSGIQMRIHRRYFILSQQVSMITSRKGRRNTGCMSPQCV